MISSSYGPAVPNAEKASEITLDAIYRALDARQSFKVEAGAGAGKTYSLIKALEHIRENRSSYLLRRDQRVACLTYTRVARDEIRRRVDGDPSIFVETLHGFLWEMIRPYRRAIIESIESSPAWHELIKVNPNISLLPVEYNLGFRSIDDDGIKLHHDDIPRIAIDLFAKSKFRLLLTDRFPVIFIDEYQDTPEGLIDAILSGIETDSAHSIFGFFGDHWQQIYHSTCGSIDHDSVIPISKNANFRSDKEVVSFLNKLRPDLPQAPKSNAGNGSVTVYHTNSWPGERLKSHWKGCISHDATQACVDWLCDISPSSDWIKSSEDLKVLMLTHSAIAQEVGYPSLPGVFKHNDSFIQKQDPVIEFLLDTLEPAIEAFSIKQYGAFFRLIRSEGQILSAPCDKQSWSELFDSLLSIRTEGTVGEVLDLLNAQRLFSIPTRVNNRHRDLGDALSRQADGTISSIPRVLEEYQELLLVPYREIIALRSYVENETVFSTQHSVKGAEFADVVVVVGRGWLRYNFAEMIASHTQPPARGSASFERYERSRNLFYVSASRSKHNLAILFVQELSADAIRNLEDWVGKDNVFAIEFDINGIPVPPSL